jgi:SH3-like domain-containing protein
VNARSGPGTRYPISWVYKRAGLPVEALAEFDNWYKVRDVEGDEGWIHRRLLSAERTGLIAGETRTVRSDPQENSAVVLYAEPGVVARIIACKAQWCRLNLQGRKGWLPREHLWGVYPEENFN